MCPICTTTGEPQVLNGSRSRSACSGLARVEDDHGRELHAGSVGGVHEAGEHREIVGAAGHGVAVEAEHLRRRVDRMGDQPAGDHRDRLQPVRERRHDPEVAAAALQRPEEVGVGRLGHVDDVAVGGHELGGQQVVGREPVLGHQPAEPAAQRETGDPGRGDRAARDGEAVLGGGVVELGPGEPGLRAHRPPGGIDVDALHLGEVDHHGAVDDGAAGHVVATAADADLEPGRAREAHARGGVLCAAAAHDHCRRAIDKAVVDATGRVIAIVRRPQEAPREAAGQVVEESRVDRHGAPSSLSAAPSLARRGESRTVGADVKAAPARCGPVGSRGHAGTPPRTAPALHGQHAGDGLGRDGRALRGRRARRARAHVLRRGPPLRARRPERPRRGVGAAVRGRARRRARVAARGRPTALDDPHPRGRAPRAPRVRLVPRRRSGAPALHAPADRAPARLRHRRALGALAAAPVRPGGVARLPAPARRPGLRRRDLRGDARVHPLAPRHERAARASRSPTSRSTRGCIARPGATRTSAGCSRPCRAR